MSFYNWFEKLEISKKKNELLEIFMSILIFNFQKKVSKRKNFV